MKTWQKMILLPGLLLILWGEPGQCLEEGESFEFQGDIRQFAVTNNTVYIATEEKLYQLNHDLTLVRSLTQRGILEGGKRVEDAGFHRVSETDEWNATFSVNILLPFVEDDALITCGVTDNGCGYCELLDLSDISHVCYSEHIQVGSPWRSSLSVGFLVNVEQASRQTYILAATQQYEDTSIKASCSTGSDAVQLHNSNSQHGFIFSSAGEFSNPSIIRKGNAEFVDGFQINSTIYLLSNLPSRDRSSNRVRLLWLEGITSKSQTLKSLRGATLSISGGGKSSRLLASSLIPGGPRVLWSGVFSVDGGQSNTQLVLFDISPDLTGQTDNDPDFYSVSSATSKPTPKKLKQKTVLFRQKNMSSVLAVRQKAWMVFFIGTGDGQLIKLAVDKNYQTTCPRVLYRANDDRQVFPNIQLDQADRKHVYVPFRNQLKRIPVSKCSSYTTVKDCWSAQDPYCVWCSSKTRCTFEDDCQDSDQLSIPDDYQKEMVSHKVMMDDRGQITLNVHTHLTAGHEALSNFTCQFSANSSELCSGESSPPQFPQCNCNFNTALLAEGLAVNVTIRLGKERLLEQLKLTNCADVRRSPTSVLCQQCIKAGCGWSENGCSWATEGIIQESACQMLVTWTNFSRPEISSITPSEVSFHGRNHAVLSGYNLIDVTRVRIQTEECKKQESPVWSNTGVSLTFHIPSADIKGEVKVCVVLPDGSCHGDAKITYQSSPSCSYITPSSSWISGKRKVTVMGSHLEFVEGVGHSHAPLGVRPPRHSNFQNLTYDTPAADNNGIFTSSVFLIVANETLACSATITYYPDPDFTSFTSVRVGDDVLIIIKKKADELEISPEELSVWGIYEEEHYPCIKVHKETRYEDFFLCEIQKAPGATFQHLTITYGDRTVRLGPPSLTLQVLTIIRIMLIPCIFIGPGVLHLEQQEILNRSDVLSAHAGWNVLQQRRQTPHVVKDLYEELNLTYNTPAADNNGIFTSSVFLIVANETLPCSATITYYPDPDFTSFTSVRVGDDVLIIIKKKADELEISPEELSVWGIYEEEHYPCIKVHKETRYEDFFLCEIQKAPGATFQHLTITYGDKTVRLGPPSLTLQVLTIIRIMLIPCIFIVLVIICQWQKKLATKVNKV